MYDSKRESLDVFAARLEKQARCLEGLGQPLGPEILGMLKAKATLDNALQSDPAVSGVADEVRILKGEYACEMCDIDGSSEQSYKLLALESLLMERNQDVVQLKTRIVSGADLATPPAQTGQPKSKAAVASPTPRLLGRPLEFKIHGQRTAGGEGTPVNQPGSGTESAVLQSFEDRLKKAEMGLAAKTLELEQKKENTVGDVLAKQSADFTQILTKLMEKAEGPRHHASTIRVEPKVIWPKLGDDGAGGREVEKFYESYKEICGLANNGKGMSDKEMLINIKTCLHGSRPTSPPHRHGRDPCEDSRAARTWQVPLSLQTGSPKAVVIGPGAS